MRIKKYLLNLLLGLDQFLNVIFGGDPDETVSSRLGRIKVKHGGSIPLYRPLSKTVDFFLDIIDPNHSIDAIEHDEGSDGIFDKPKKK